MKFITVSELRKLENQVSHGWITYSRMVEIINLKAEEYYSQYVCKLKQNENPIKSNP